jgi:hypothetical protein
MRATIGKEEEMMRMEAVLRRSPLVVVLLKRGLKRFPITGRLYNPQKATKMVYIIVTISKPISILRTRVVVWAASTPPMCPVQIEEKEKEEGSHQRPNANHNKEGGVSD